MRVAADRAPSSPSPRRVSAARSAEAEGNSRSCAKAGAPHVVTWAVSLARVAYGHGRCAFAARMSSRRCGADQLGIRVVAHTACVLTLLGILFYVPSPESDGSIGPKRSDDRSVVMVARDDRRTPR